jgi:hypothetical protein
VSLWLCKQKKATGFYMGVFITHFNNCNAFNYRVNSRAYWTTLLKSGQQQQFPPDFEQIRNKWKTYHAIRTFLSLTGFVCFALFILSEQNRKLFSN